MFLNNLKIVLFLKIHLDHHNISNKNIQKIKQIIIRCKIYVK
jgi:hypothetical protein